MASDSSDTCRVLGPDLGTKPRAPGCAHLSPCRMCTRPRRKVLPAPFQGEKTSLQAVACPRSETLKNRGWDFRQPDTSPPQTVLAPSPHCRWNHSVSPVNSCVPAPLSRSHPGFRLQCLPALFSPGSTCCHRVSSCAPSCPPAGAPSLPRREVLILSAAPTSRWDLVPPSHSWKIHRPERQKYHEIAPPLTFFW